MGGVRLRVDEVFDIPARGGLVAVASPLAGEFVGVPRLRDVETGHVLRILGVDHPTPRTRRTGQAILVVDRADAAYVTAGRTWESLDG
jgi:hypothetical protein